MGIFLDKPMVLDRIKEHYSLKSNADLARFLGVAPNTITNWYGRKTFDLDIIFTKCVGVDFNWLLTGEDSMLRHSKNSEETKLGVIPNATPISPAEESIIYKMYKDEKEEKERLVKEKETKIDHLQSELRSKSEELAVLKAQYQHSGEPVIAFTPGSPEAYTENSLLTKKPITPSKKLSAGKT